MALREEILEVLNNRVVENGSIPNGFTQFLERRERPYTRQQGNVVTNAYPVFFGSLQNKRWQLFWECPENEARTLLDNNPGLRFDIDNPFDIPSLADGRQVKYYLNRNIGYGPEIVSLREGMLEYGRRVGRQILDDGRLERPWVPNNGNANRDIPPPRDANYLVDEEQMPLQEQIKQLVESNLQVILTGAPGTGKTFTAKQVAFAITGDNENTPEEESHVKSVQFHPGYDYSDFVIGLKPVILDAQGNELVDEQDGDVAARGDVHVSFRWKDGIFKDFAQRAKWAYDAAVHDGGEVPKFVFLIDEINRADLSRVFGELFSLLEEDYRYRIREGAHENVHGITLPNGKKFVIPENLYIIGTMNDIDRSVESMDFALRRRFAWREVSADESSCIIEAKINDEDVRRRLQTAMRNINEKIADQNLRLGTEYQLGGAIFAKYMKYEGYPDAFERLWKNHIETILTEYLRGRRDKKEKLDGLKAVYDNAVQDHPPAHPAAEAAPQQA